MINLSKIFYGVLFSILFTSISDSLFSQRTEKNVFSFYLNRPIPGSDITFNKRYEDKFSAEFSYHRYFCEEIFGGISINYAKFQIEQTKIPFYLMTKMHVASASLMAGYDYEVLIDTYLNGIIKTGYSWVFFRNADYPEDAKANDVSGFSIEPSAQVCYKLTKYFKVGMQMSYKIIFSYFGKESEFGIKEDPNIRFWTYGIFTSFSF
jgi:hypothetical protein